MDETPPRPTSTEDRDGWEAYWTAQGMPWRTEPVISEERQRYLAQRRAVRPEIEKGIFPLRDEHGPIKVTRADLEWLVATHRGQEGVDLRGADLRGMWLQRLPLIRARGCLDYLLLLPAVTELAREMASVRLDGADLRRADLHGALLRDAHLERADLGHANLQGADLSVAHLESAHLSDANLRGANLGGAAPGATVAHLEGARLDSAHLEGARLTYARLEHARLIGAHLEGANLTYAQMAGADLRRATFDELSKLDHVHLSSKRDGTALLGDVKWNSVDLTLVEWHEVKRLGDEVPPPLPLPKDAVRLPRPRTSGPKAAWKRFRARLRSERSGRVQKRDDSSATLRMGALLGLFLLFVVLAVALSSGLRERFEPYRSAARAYRRLSMTLREQGMADEADRFAYRAQVCQRRMYFRGLRIPRWLLSWVLCVVAGYGYKPLRVVLCYLVVLASFSFAFFQATHGALGLGLPPSKIQPLTWYEAAVLSVSSFHGRGFFQALDSLGDPVAILAAIEAVFGLLIEVSFIATFTQRFFAR